MSSFFEHSPLTQYTTPPNNYIGSTIFLSYIFVALYLTSTIGYALFTQYSAVFHSHPSSPTSKFKQNGQGKIETRGARKRHVKIYGFLALISFVSICWHMLGFLITSFLDWRNSGTRHMFEVPGNTAFDKLKMWMLETSLFNDFAVQLVADGESAVWTQGAILATWFWNLFLASKGRQYSLNLNTMLPFIVLGQNLPISFTAALFIVQLHLCAPDVNGNSNKAMAVRAQPKQRPVASLMLPTLLLNAALLAQPSLRAHPRFSYLLLFERLLLVLPHTGLLKNNAADVQRSAAISGGFVVANWAMMRKSLAVGDVFTALVWKGQAVKTMGWDAVLSAVVYGVLSWGGGV